LDKCERLELGDIILQTFSVEKDHMQRSNHGRRNDLRSDQFKSELTSKIAASYSDMPIN